MCWGGRSCLGFTSKQTSRPPAASHDQFCLLVSVDYELSAAAKTNNALLINHIKSFTNGEGFDLNTGDRHVTPVPAWCMTIVPSSGVSLLSPTAANRSSSSGLMVAVSSLSAALLSDASVPLGHHTETNFTSQTGNLTIWIFTLKHLIWTLFKASTPDKCHIHLNV